MEPLSELRALQWRGQNQGQGRPMGKEGTSKNLSYGVWAALGGQRVPLFDGAAVVWQGAGGRLKEVGPADQRVQVSKMYCPSGPAVVKRR